MEPECASKMMIYKLQLSSVTSTRCFTVACGMDFVELKSLESIIGRRTTTCLVIGVRSNKSVVLNMTLVISSSPLLYSFDLPRSCMYLVPSTFHHRFAGIYGCLFRWGPIFTWCYPKKSTRGIMKELGYKV